MTTKRGVGTHMMSRKLFSKNRLSGIIHIPHLAAEAIELTGTVKEQSMKR